MSRRWCLSTRRTWSCLISRPRYRQGGADVEAIRKWVSGYSGAISYEVRDLNVAACDDEAVRYSYNVQLAATDYGATRVLSLAGVARRQASSLTFFRSIPYGLKAV